MALILTIRCGGYWILETKDLLPFISWTIHVVYKSFYKGIVALRQNFEGPAYTLIHGLNVHHALKILEKF